MSGFGHDFTFAKLPLHASLLPKQFVTDEAEEMLKWDRAKNFTLNSSHNMVDLAYDGAFVKADIEDFCQAVNASRLEWIFVDDEGWPAFSGWVQGCCSPNAEAQRLPGESDANLSWRMVSEFMHLWSGCLKGLPTASGGTTMIGYYGNSFPAGIYQPAGFVGMPSVYDEMKALRHFATGLQQQRREMTAVVDDGLGPASQLTARRQLLPWLTAACHGQMTSADVMAGALHSFGAGSSGFAFFADMGLDDPGKILALSSAAGLAAPFAEHFFAGSSVAAPDQLTYGSNILASAGMRLGLSVWLVVTLASPGRGAELTLTLPFGSVRTVHVCELMSGKRMIADVTAGAVKLSLRYATDTVVLHVSPEAASCAPTELWHPAALRLKTDDIEFFDCFTRSDGELGNGWSEGFATTGNYSKLGIWNNSVTMVGPTMDRPGGAALRPHRRCKLRLARFADGIYHCSGQVVGHVAEPAPHRGRSAAPYHARHAGIRRRHLALVSVRCSMPFHRHDRRPRAFICTNGCRCFQPHGRSTS